MELIHYSPEAVYYCGKGGDVFHAVRRAAAVTCPDCMYRLVALADELEAQARADAELAAVLEWAAARVIEKAAA